MTQQPGCVDCSTPSQSDAAKSPADVKSQAPRPSGKYYSLDLFVGSDNQSRSLLSMFNTDPKLKTLANNCNYHVYAPGDELYKQRYSQWIPLSQFPAIVMTRPDGGHVYIASKAEIPTTAAAIQSSIKKATEDSLEAERQANLARTESAESPESCVDGTCRKPPFFNRNPNDDSVLFPNRQPDPTDLITGFFRSQGIGLESVALLVIAIVVIVLIFKQK